MLYDVKILSQYLRCFLIPIFFDMVFNLLLALTLWYQTIYHGTPPGLLPPPLPSFRPPTSLNKGWIIFPILYQGSIFFESKVSFFLSFFRSFVQSFVRSFICFRSSFFLILIFFSVYVCFYFKSLYRRLSSVFLLSHLSMYISD